MGTLEKFTKVGISNILNIWMYDQTNYEASWPYFKFYFLLGIYTGSGGTQEVAIKIPKITLSAGCSTLEIETLKSFYIEVQVILGFSHENVLSCIGISTGISFKNNVYCKKI